ncbi:flagellar basal-body rod protein FlgF [Alphaproteobacteria bacterium 46_93_T64]|nr:flagellar basal-body rod protein FlgF [Alphaproteobacteria bacterium 46_93_T64]
MENAIYIGLSQQMALKRHMDITANNLANMTTTAYKSVSPVFQEFLSDELQGQEVSFVQDYGMYHDKSVGQITATGRPLDLAISGDGFFSVQTDDGIRYTRAGSFKLDPDGFLTTVNGDFLLDEGGNTIQVDLANPSIEIAPDGTVNLGGDQSTKLELTAFDNDQLLKQEGNGYYDPDGAELRVAEGSSILQGSLEGSNVNPILEMTNMIEIMRSYTAAQKLLDAEHDMQMKSIEELPAMN